MNDCRWWPLGLLHHHPVENKLIQPECICIGSCCGKEVGDAANLLKIGNRHTLLCSVLPYLREDFTRRVASSRLGQLYKHRHWRSYFGVYPMPTRIVGSVRCPV